MTTEESHTSQLSGPSSHIQNNSKILDVSKTIAKTKISAKRLYIIVGFFFLAILGLSFIFLEDRNKATTPTNATATTSSSPNTMDYTSTTYLTTSQAQSALQKKITNSMSNTVCRNYAISKIKSLSKMNIPTQSYTNCTSIQITKGAASNVKQHIMALYNDGQISSSQMTTFISDLGLQSV
jgi:hypothetical protein